MSKRAKPKPRCDCQREKKRNAKIVARFVEGTWSVDASMESLNVTRATVENALRDALRKKREKR